jgi:hypothetical protein
MGAVEAAERGGGGETGNIDAAGLVGCPATWKEHSEISGGGQQSRASVDPRAWGHQIE